MQGDGRGIAAGQNSVDLAAYDAVAHHVAANELAATGPPREVYLTDLDADAEQEMQIVFPIGGDPLAAGGRGSKA